LRALSRNCRTWEFNRAMLTGDNQTAARCNRNADRNPSVHAEVLPQGKTAEIARSMGGGMSLAMVGDGINDAAALAEADVALQLAQAPTLPLKHQISHCCKLICAVSWLALSSQKGRWTTIRQNFRLGASLQFNRHPDSRAGVSTPEFAAAAMARVRYRSSPTHCASNDTTPLNGFERCVTGSCINVI